MAKRKKRRGSRMKAIPIAPIAPVLFTAVRAYHDGGDSWEKKGKYFAMYTTGYDAGHHDFRPAEAVPFWAGTLAGVIVHKVANKTINKYIRKATFGYLCL